MLELVLLLAQTCVAEIDLQKNTKECEVMWAVNSREADRRGVSLTKHTRQFNAFWDPRTKVQRLWIEGLGFTGLEPEHWPKNRSWEREAHRWEAYLTASALFVDSLKYEQDLTCRMANDYGGDPDDGKYADDYAPCPQAVRVKCLRREHQAYWNTRPCRRARRNSARLISAAAASRGYGKRP